jgi:hypothetical protein
MDTVLGTPLSKYSRSSLSIIGGKLGNGVEFGSVVAIFSSPIIQQ